MPGQNRNILVGIRLDRESRDLLSWALVKVAEPGDSVVAVHVTPTSGRALREKLLLEGYLEVYESLCSAKQVDLKGQIFKGSSKRKILIREARNYDAVALVVGIGKRSALGGWTSLARYCAKRLPTTTNVLAIKNGKTAFTRSNHNQSTGLKGDPRPSLRLNEIPVTRECQSEYGDSEVGSEISSFDGIQSCKDRSRTGEDSKSEVLGKIREEKELSLRSNSFSAGEFMNYKPGWPLLLRASLATPEAKQARSISIVKWVMNLPTRSPYHTPHCPTIKENPLEIELSGSGDENHCTDSMEYELQKCLGMLLKKNSSNCLWISYKVLEAATAQFSPENLIGKGGSNRVYKGILPDGKAVAVKILKSSQTASKDFANEIEIISSLMHKHIMPLIGICVKENDLISVYDYSSKGSLEEIMHGKNKEKETLSWEVRYNVAVGIAEGLNYLHKERARPVIHRDVKSSNILLSDGFEPKLSDFGLAVWGPTDSSYLTQPDVVGTFGYLAPEYFMYGKLSDKIDVYAFGVVLLELLSGKKPISFDNPKGQQSLVMWAKPIMESGDVECILDPNLKGNINETQMKRMVLAATLCITQSARLRPKMNEILELLREDKLAVAKWAEKQNENTEGQDHTDDEVYPISIADLHLSLARLDADDNSTSFSSMEQSSNLSMEEYLKERWSRSSSFD